jgi:site-specific recombinase XerC
VSRLTLADAARMMRQALRDRSYRATPLGLEVSRYYRWKKNEWGATAETLRDYEAILAKLALDHADLQLADFAPPVGTERLREFIDNRWGERTPRTRAKVISVLRDFFAWTLREGKLSGNPAAPIFRPRKREVARGTFTATDAAKVIASQPRLRDRVALLLFFRLGLRKSELARVQFKHYDRPQPDRLRQGRNGAISARRRLRPPDGTRAAHTRPPTVARRAPAVSGEAGP